MESGHLSFPPFLSPSLILRLHSPPLFTFTSLLYCLSSFFVVSPTPCSFPFRLVFSCFSLLWFLSLFYFPFILCPFPSFPFPFFLFFVFPFLFSVLLPSYSPCHPFSIFSFSFSYFSFFPFLSVAFFLAFSFFFSFFPFVFFS